MTDVRVGVDGAHPQMKDQEPPRFSPTEVIAAIKALTIEEKTAINKIARFYAAKWHRIADHDDLLHEAFIRVIDQRRAWPRDLPAIVFFHGTIKSIVSETKFEFLSQGVDEEVADRADSQASVERWREEEAAKNAAEYRAEVLGCLVDDPVAQKIVIGIMDGRRGEELRAESGLSETEYDSKRRKIRRRIEKLKSD